MTTRNKKGGESAVDRRTRAQVAQGLADVAEGLRWDLEHELDESARLVIAAGITLVEGCRLAVKSAKDQRTVEKHLRTARAALIQIDEIAARYRDRLAIPDKIGSDAIH